MVGDLNINSFDYDNNALVKNFFNLFFHSGFLPLIQRATRVTRATMKCKIGQIFALMKPTVLFWKIFTGLYEVAFPKKRNWN